MRPDHRRTLSAAAAALLLAPAAHAADAPLQEVVVSAARLSQPLSELASATVIDRAEIERRGAVFAGDLLATVPGAAVSRAGPFGGVTSLILRGAPSDKTLVLIDGAPVNDPSQPAGGFDFAALDLYDVEKIEILAGPQASLWGSDAIGGVINVVTREPNGLRAGTELGAFEARRFTGSAGFSNAKAALGLSVADFDTDGISKADARFGNTETDPFHTVTASANGRLNPADGVKLEARLRFSRAKTHYDSFGGPTGVIDGPDTSKVDVGSGVVRAEVAGPLGFTHTFSFDASETNRRYDGAFPFKARGGRQDWRWMAAQDPGAAPSLAVGAERMSAHEDTGDGRQSAGSTAAFAIVRWAPLPLASGTLSVRYDDPDGYAGQTSVRASGVAALGQGFRLAASVGQGFKVPSLFETTYPCFECLTPGPNRTLRPERAEGWDATLSWADGGGRAEASLTLYGLRIRNRIDYQYPQGYLNVARATTTGAEAKAAVKLGAGFTARAGWAWTDAKDSLTGAQLRVPRHAGTAELDWAGGPLEAAVLARAQTGAPDVYGRIKGFTVVGATAAYALSPRLRLTLRAENLLDRRYEEAFGYGEPGRSVYAGLEVRY